ncbi:uncharacterized protein LOC125261473 [Megalobrama amblycephala]|uniref:uncharacterized protein LOC125261473 n=1 Tax=Megalobrama amblycephala TaxID=75352 RepID=UPI002014526A|nr:uncharacterized protein LOC125261473 [Megalobrama amblycephala]
MKFLYFLILCLFFVPGAYDDVDTDKVSVSVMEGDSVTLQTDVKINQQVRMTWYFNDIRIAQINGDLHRICVDDLCKERFRDRLKLDHQTGSLTITNTRNTDSGEYTLQTINKRVIQKIFSVAVRGSSGVGSEGVSVSVKEGDSVTLQTDVKMNHQDRIRWYFNDTRIAVIRGDLSFICTDVQCNEGTERFRDRLKLDNQTGSLTITNIKNTDSGFYQLQIIRRRIIQKIFNVAANDVPADEQDESVKEGESVTLDPGGIKSPYYVMMWYFNDILIAEIIVKPNKTYISVHSEDSDERFRDRLKLDHQTGCLTIMNTRNTDSGLYKLQLVYSIHSHHNISITSVKRFSITVIDSTLPLGLIVGIVAAVVIGVPLVAATVVCLYHLFFKGKLKSTEIL